MRIKSFKFSDSFARSNSEYRKIIPTKRDDLFRITIQSLVRIVGRKEKLSFPMNILRSRWMKSRARRKEYSRFNVNLTGKVNTSTLVMNFFFFFFSLHTRYVRFRSWKKYNSIRSSFGHDQVYRTCYNCRSHYQVSENLRRFARAETLTRFVPRPNHRFQLFVEKKSWFYADFGIIGLPTNRGFLGITDNYHVSIKWRIFEEYSKETKFSNYLTL